MVSKLTETALKIKAALESSEGDNLLLYSIDPSTNINSESSLAISSSSSNNFAQNLSNSGFTSSSNTNIPSGSNLPSSSTSDQTANTNPANQISMNVPTTNTDSIFCSLFAGPKVNKSPIRVEHIQEAYRRFQHTPQHIRNFKGGLKRTRVSLI
ncbi:hypothetical protein AYI69_g6377 [Smittium culicis]|uniref:Uncharacterized protein n=1 Tax=Smittium culicis TaxID=133412 RepID=A0A1R1XZD7_9FUNG|nr:hypothetical protein AYI69_g6377 [Smittium culicis]